MGLLGLLELLGFIGLLESLEVGGTDIVRGLRWRSSMVLAFTFWPSFTASDNRAICVSSLSAKIPP